MNAKHRHAQVIPWTVTARHFVVRTAVLGLAIAIVATVVGILTGQNAAAVNDAWQASSDAALVHLAQATHPAPRPRPYWDGRHPAVWTNRNQPMCPTRDHGRHGWIQPGGNGPEMRAQCVPIGTEGYAWEPVNS